jgi:hypothetical protein
MPTSTSKGYCHAEHFKGLPDGEKVVRPNPQLVVKAPFYPKAHSTKTQGTDDDTDGSGGGDAGNYDAVGGVGGATAGDSIGGGDDDWKVGGKTYKPAAAINEGGDDD